MISYIVSSAIRRSSLDYAIDSAIIDYTIDSAIIVN